MFNNLSEMMDEVMGGVTVRPTKCRRTTCRHQTGSLDQEIRELKSAYLSMRKMTADYDKMETAFNDAMDMDDSGYSTDMMGPCPDAAEWLNSNYEEHEGISLPRSVMYSHYIDHCHENETDPVNQASFGKIIRSVFPNIKTRRLGNRGQSKYHYYGIKIKENSPYREVMVNAQRINTLCASPKNAFSKTTLHSSSMSAPSSNIPSSQTSFTLPDFPSVNDITLPAQMKETTGVFLIMYRHHLQRIVDTVLRANFTEVKGFVSHFWTTLPVHISSILYHEKVIKVICFCDTILYSSITNVLIPGVTQPLPASLLQAIRAFSRNYLKWLEDALSQQPAELQKQKMQAARTFSRSLSRQTEVSHMSSVARSVLHNSESIKRLQQDWKKLDKESIAKQCTWLLMDDEATALKLIAKYLNDFEAMMEQQTTIDRYIEWVRVLAGKFIDKRADHNTYKATARDFLLKWSFISNIVIKELTMRSAETFGSYHLLSMLFKDYIIHLVDQRLREDDDRQLQQSVYSTELREHKQFTTTKNDSSANYGQRQNYEQFLPISNAQTNDVTNNDLGLSLDNKTNDGISNAMQSTSLPSIYEMFSMPQVCTDSAMQALHPNETYDLEKHTGRYYPNQQDSYNHNTTYKYYCTSDGNSLTML